jgi:hypothetical protein
MELTIDLQDVSKLKPLFAWLDAFTLDQGVKMTVTHSQGAVYSFPVSEEERATAWRDLQEIVRRNKLRSGEAEMSAEEEEAFILREVKAARLEERVLV